MKKESWNAQNSRGTHSSEPKRAPFRPGGITSEKLDLFFSNSPKQVVARLGERSYLAQVQLA